MKKFNSAIMAYLHAKDCQAEFARDRLPPSVMEMATEVVAKKLGLAREAAKESPLEVPPLSVLRKGTVDGMKMCLSGKRTEGNALLQMTHAIRDAAYPNASLKTKATVKLMADIKRGSPSC